MRFSTTDVGTGLAGTGSLETTSAGTVSGVGEADARAQMSARLRLPVGRLAVMTGRAAAASNARRASSITCGVGRVLCFS